MKYSAAVSRGTARSTRRPNQYTSSDFFGEYQQLHKYEKCCGKNHGYTTSDGREFVNSLIVGRSYAGAVTLNGTIYLYIMGGRNRYRLFRSVGCYNPDSNTWTPCSNMTNSHVLPSVAPQKGHIYECRLVERYYPEQDTWSQVCSLEVDHIYIPCVSLDNKQWAIGGKSKSADKSCVSVFDEENFCWVERCSLAESEVLNCFVVPESLLSSM